LLGGRRGGAWVRCLGWGGSGCPTHLSPTPPPLPKKTKKDGRARSFRHRAPAWWSSAPVSSPRSMSRPRRLLAGLGLDTCRIQFTPDLMPFDILSSEVLDEVGAAKGRDRQRDLPRSARLVSRHPRAARARASEVADAPVLGHRPARQPWLPFAADSIRQQFGTQMPQGGHPPHHSITSSARASSEGGTVSTLAAWALMTSSNFVDCMTGSVKASRRHHGNEIVGTARSIARRPYAPHRNLWIGVHHVPDASGVLGCAPAGAQERRRCHRVGATDIQQRMSDLPYDEGKATIAWAQTSTISSEENPVRFRTTAIPVP